LFKGHISKQALTGVAILFIGGIIGASYYIINEGIPLLDQLIFSKSDSESGIERAMLNESALTAFIDSFGIGIGLGSTRASSFLLVLLSNTGLVGALLYGAFLYKSFVLPKDMSLPVKERSYIIACREGAIGGLIAASLSHAVFDLGLLIYILAGAAAAIALKKTPPQASAASKSSLKIESSRPFSLHNVKCSS
jgi:hypothetical protein